MRQLLFCICLSLLVACRASDDNPEQAIRDWVARGETAAEARDRGELMNMISERYTDSRGNDQERLGQILRLQFLRQDSIALLTNIEDIVVSGDTAALVRLTVGMAGTGSGAFGFDADAYRFELELEKPDDDWLLIGARWGELGTAIR
jgi:hypothetical protein